MDEVEITNPVDRYLLTLTWIPLAVGAITGLLLSTDGYVLPLIGCSVVGCIVVGVDYYREYVIRPKTVSLRDDGIVLHFRLRRDRFFPWDDIKGIYSKPGPERTKWGRNIGKGGVRMRSIDTFFLVSYPISQAIISRYTKENGRRPYTWDGS